MFLTATFNFMSAFFKELESRNEVRFCLGVG